MSEQFIPYPSPVFNKGRGQYEQWPDVSGVNAMAIGYHNTQIQPRAETRFNSRKEVNPSVNLGPYQLQYGIISAPMKGVTGVDLARAMAENGMIGALYPFPIDTVCQIADQFTRQNLPCIYTTRLNDPVVDANKIFDAGGRVILIDTAHGGMQSVFPKAEALKKIGFESVIAGNITTYQQALSYVREGTINIARGLVGPGDMCETKITTGVGTTGEISAIFDMRGIPSPHLPDGYLKIIADGGVKNYGDIAKAFAAGADYVMAGSLFAGFDESNKIYDEDGNLILYGEASAHAMTERGTEATEWRNSEGRVKQIEHRGPIEPTLNKVKHGVRSAMSYANAGTMREFVEHTVWAMDYDRPKREVV